MRARLKREIRSINVPDFKAMEGYFSNKAQEGLMLKSADGPLLSYLKGDPKSLVFKVTKVAPTYSFIAFKEYACDRGWDFVCGGNKMIVFCAPKDRQVKPLYESVEGEFKSLAKHTKQMAITTSLLLMWLFYMVIKSFQDIEVRDILRNDIFWAPMILVASLVFLSIVLYPELKWLNRNQDERETLKFEALDIVLKRQKLHSKVFLVLVLFYFSRFLWEPFSRGVAVGLLMMVGLLVGSLVIFSELDSRFSEKKRNSVLLMVLGPLWIMGMLLMTFTVIKVGTPVEEGMPDVSIVSFESLGIDNEDDISLDRVYSNLLVAKSFAYWTKGDESGHVIRGEYIRTRFKWTGDWILDLYVQEVNEKSLKYEGKNAASVYISGYPEMDAVIDLYGEGSSYLLKKDEVIYVIRYIEGFGEAYLETIIYDLFEL